MAALSSPVIQLLCHCNEYPWGKKGKDSLAARLCVQTPGTDFELDESKSYAEMWFGTYPALPSYCLATGEDLQDILDKNTDLIGDKVIKKFGHSKIPYLPKVLSIAKALPLQVHPNKELSAKLHDENPDKFTDPNHKPEIAIALGEFEAFVGWKPLDDVQSLFTSLPPLDRYLDDSVRQFDNEALKNLAGKILKDSDENIKQVQEELAKLPKDKDGKHVQILELLPRLQDQYGKTDPGNLVALLMMNYLKLKEGESIYIPADGIHAYLGGDIIECMARSNNVLNTGFCPRADRDSIDLFTSTLTFSPHKPQEAMLEPKPWDRGVNGKTTLYAPPMSEFKMLRTSLGEGEQEVLKKMDGPSIFVVTKGTQGRMTVEGKKYPLSEGYVYFVGQGTEIELQAEKQLELYLAFVE